MSNLAIGRAEILDVAPRTMEVANLLNANFTNLEFCLLSLIYSLRSTGKSVKPSWSLQASSKLVTLV